MLSIVDWIVIIVYASFVICEGFYLGKKSKSQEDYFIGGREFKWWAIGLSVIATQVSAVTFIGAPGWAYQGGLSAIILTLNIPVVMWFISGVIAPFFYNSGVISVYEYVEWRFGPVMRFLTAIVFIFKTLLVVGTLVYAPALVLSRISGMSLNMTISIMVVASVIYTMAGGLKAVIWTDVVQMSVLWAGLAVSFFIVIKSMPSSFLQSIALAKEAEKLTALDFSPGLNVTNGVWAGLIGGGILHLSYFGVDQTQVQRILAAKSMKNVKVSLWFGGVVVVIQMFLFMLMGALLYIYYGGMPFENPNDVLIKFVVENIPTGILGLIIAAVFAAAMSSIDSALNSISTVFVKDIYERWVGREVSQEASLRISRLSTFGWGIIVAWFAFVVSNSKLPILEAISKYGSYIYGSILGVFLLGMYTTKANEKGTIVGFVAGIASVAYVAQNTQVAWTWNTFIGLFVTVALGYAVSIMTGGETKNVERFTIKGQKAQFEKNQLQVEEDGVFALPGRFEKASYGLKAYFAVVVVLLYVLGS